MIDRLDTLFPAAMVQLLTAGTLACALVLVGAAMGQGQAPEAQQQGQTESRSIHPAEAGPSARLNERKLEAFVSAALRVTTIQRDWEPRIRQAQSLDRVSQLAQDVNAEIVSAIEGEGLTPEEYAAIWRATRDDPDLRHRVIQLAQEHRG